MPFSFDETFAAEVFLLLAEVRDESTRWRQLVEVKEDDGLDLADAQLDAAKALGLLGQLTEALTEALTPLLEVLESAPLAIHVRDERSTMPTLHHYGGLLRLDLTPAPLQALVSITRRLAERMAAEPERTAVTIEVGLGGTGGCASGACLPEDAPPGPLFERRPAPL